MELNLCNDIEIELSDQQIVDLIFMNSGIGKKLRTVESLVISGKCKLTLDRKKSEITISGTCENTGLKFDFIQKLNMQQLYSIFGKRLEIPRVEEVRINSSPWYSFFGGYKKKSGPNGKITVRAKISFFPVLPSIRTTHCQ